MVVEDMIAEGDKVLVRWACNGTQTGNLWGIPPTDRPISVKGNFAFRLADGKIVEQWGIWTTRNLFTQLGLIPPWGELVEQAKAKLG